MRKSSLGRRSSTHIPVRIPSLGASGSRLSTQPKLQTSSTKRNVRSQSEDRESYGDRLTLPGSMVRSSTAGSIPRHGMGAMTPITPRSSIHSNLPTGSTRAPRNQTTSTDSNRRMSSIGGTKNPRKDSRPIAEKAFQIAAQARVQQYFDTHGMDVISPGSKIKPMNTNMFIEMMDHLLKKMDARIVITKSNYLEELPVLLRKLGYRSKVDRSWLMTVNTPHSWQHVIGVLSWLVDFVDVTTSCFDTWETMFTNFAQVEEEPNEDISIDKELIRHLKRTFRVALDTEQVNEMDTNYIEKQIVDERCADEDLEILKRENDLKYEETVNELKIRDQFKDNLEALQETHKALMADYNSSVKYIEDSKHVVVDTEKKVAALQQEFAIKKEALEKKQKEFQELKEKVNAQVISMAEKEKMAKERQEILRMIKFYDNTAREFDKVIFSVDLKFAEDQRKLEKSVLEYNKVIAGRVIDEPRLKDCEVKFRLLSKPEDIPTEVVDNTLKTLKDEYKNSIQKLKQSKDEDDNTLWKLKQEIKVTEEDIAKKTTLLESVEHDLEKQEDLINKETQKLKDELNHNQKVTKEIEELLQFDPKKLEENKNELKKVQHDWELLKKKSKEFFEKYTEATIEAFAVYEDAVMKIRKLMEDFKNKHL